jgi:hypothetical protein
MDIEQKKYTMNQEMDLKNTKNKTKQKATEKKENKRKKKQNNR